MKAALNFRVRVFFKSAVRGKMFLDCFQLNLEKVKLIESVDRSTDTTHKLVIM